MTTEPVQNAKAALTPFRPKDVLLGRGSGPNRWTGNIHFRELVLKTFQDYVDSSFSEERSPRDRIPSFSSLDPFLKNRLARIVLQAIERESGRFLQRMSKEEFERGPEPAAAIVHQEEEKEKGGEVVTYFYTVASEKKAMEKIKQTFRFLNDQKQARRLSKVAEARRISDEAVKATFGATAAGKALDGAATRLDQQVASPLVFRTQSSLQSNLPTYVIEGQNTYLTSLLSSRISGSMAPLPFPPFTRIRNIAHPSDFSTLLRSSSVGSRMTEDINSVLLAERKFQLDRQLLLTSSLRTAGINEDILRRPILPQQREPQLSIAAAQEALDLARSLNRDGSLYPSNPLRRTPT
ncbi:hypothetical protein IV203_033284 [Nitzschia inconspicua]|uniref:DUF6824 domain-containing protein n=1 Tax=Nitzschia inconspicua TaxID=303405 RepID=A0A9K3KMV0_9STRA|nr:hypothetical protein IV203_033284 [Nitzschia inconspicua]